MEMLDNNMNILFLTREFPPMVGGVADYTFLLANTLRQYEHAPIVLTSDTHEIKTFADKCDFDVYPQISRWNITGMKQIISKIKKISPQILSLQYVSWGYGKYGIHFYLLFWILWIKLWTNIPIAVTFHETYPKWGRNPRYWIIYFIQRIEVFCLGCLADCLIITTEARKKVFHRLFPWKKHIYRIPISPTVPRAMAKESELKKLRSELVLDGQFLIVTFGKFQFMRRYELMIEALAKHNETHPDQLAKLILIGPVNKSKRFEQLKALEQKLGVEDQVAWLGVLSAANLSRHLQISDIFLSIQSEAASTKSTTLAAAFEHGLPVIASRGENPDSIFQHGINIYLVEENLDSLVQGIATLIANDDLRNRMSREARNTYQRFLSWEVVTQEHIEAFTKIFDKKKEK